VRTVLLIRHGAVVGDADRRFIGATDWPMSEGGEAQVRRLANWLGARFPIASIYCSDLFRSRRTAELLAAEGRQPIHVRSSLREINLGAWEGVLRAELARSEPDEYARRGRDIVDYRPTGGESFSDLAGRVLPCWRSLIAGERDEVVAVAGHCGVNRVILCDILGMPLANLFRIGQRPGCLNMIAWSASAPVVRLLDAVEL
jgi:probable phosphoglycerate mutase